MEENRKQPSQEEKDLTIIRLEVLSPELHFTSGNDLKKFSRDEMIEEIRNNTDTGKEFVKTEFEFLRAFKDGSLIKILTSNNQ